jgi:hypothetical protein
VRTVTAQHADCTVDRLGMPPVSAAAHSSPWPIAPSSRAIYSTPFDLTLLAGPALAGLLAAAAAIADPRLYAPLLFADLWLLGYHHVVATYTRMTFDTGSLVRHRFLAVDLLLLMTAATMTVAFTAGAWVIASAFLYLQWFHYMRQGYGIARMYFRATAAGQVPGSRDLVTDAVIYLVPIYGIAARSASMGDTFLNLPVKAIVLPGPLVAGLGALAAMAVGAWVLQSVRHVARGTFSPAYTAFVLSHVAIFMAAYVVIDNVNVGWLAINIWHNFQYVMVVWMTNLKRFAGGIDPQARFLSRISQPGRAVSYFGCCIAISTLIYIGIDRVAAATIGTGIGATIGIYMGINFHHYVVDAVIWRRKRAVVQAA